MVYKLDCLIQSRNKKGGFGSRLRQTKKLSPALGPLQYSAAPAPQHWFIHATVIVSAQNMKFFCLGSMFEETSIPGETRELPIELSFWETKSWEVHVETRNETTILERSAAVGLDYIYTIEFPSDASSEDISDLASNMEYSNLPERALCRLVLGPAALHVDAGAAQRFKILADLAATCESSSGSRYGGGLDDRVGGGGSPRVLEIPTKEEIDSLENNNPCRQYRITLLHPSLTLHGPSSLMELGLRCLDVTILTPMYPLRNVKVASVLHPPSKMILNNCHNIYSVTFMEFFGRMVQNENSIKLVSIEKLKLSSKSLLLKPYWKNVYQKHGDIHLEIEALKGRISVGTVQAGQAILSYLLPSAAATRVVEGSEVGLSDPRLKVVIARAKGSWTWTSRISTVSAVVDSIVTTYEEVALSGRPHISATVFSGLQQKGEIGQPPADHWPSTPGKAEREVPISPWLRLLVQFPVGAEIQFVPPILMVTLNASRMVLAPGLLAQCRAGLRPSSRTAADQQLAAKGAADSGFKSVEAGNILLQQEQLPTPLGRSLFLSELLRSAIIKVKSEEFRVYLVKELEVSCSADCIEDTVRRLRSKHIVLLVDLPKVEAFNSGGRIDTSLFQQHPVLCPPSVWISGKDTLPISVNLTGFQILVVGEEKQLLAPISTK